MILGNNLVVDAKGPRGRFYLSMQLKYRRYKWPTYQASLTMINEASFYGGKILDFLLIL